MNIKDLLPKDKSVSIAKLFETERGTVRLLQILESEQLKEHITNIPALLICVIGEVIFENEQDVKETLLSGDFIKIEPNVKHKVIAIKGSQLLLFK